MFKPTGFLKKTRELEYEAYCQGIEDAMDVILNERPDPIILTPLDLRNKLLNLVVEAADDFID
jgi:hypothetical protein